MGITLSTNTNAPYTIARQSNARELGYKIDGTDISSYLDVPYNEYTVAGTSTFTMPNRASYLAVVLIGGGGGGGQGGWGSNNNIGRGAGGGGGGAIFVSKPVLVSSGTSITIAVGTGGTGATGNINLNNGVNGGETSIKIGTTKIFGAGGGGKGNNGWNQDNALPSYSVGVGGSGGTKYINTNYTSYEYQSSTGGSGVSIPYLSGTAYINGGKGGDISMNFIDTPAYYSDISYAGGSGGNYTIVQNGDNGTGYGTGGGGGAGNTGNATGGTGGNGGSGYARIYFYV